MVKLRWILFQNLGCFFFDGFVLGKWGFLYFCQFFIESTLIFEQSFQGIYDSATECQVGTLGNFFFVIEGYFFILGQLNDSSW